MKIFFSGRARRTLDEFSLDVKHRIESKISELLFTPYPAGCKKLKGLSNSYRLRVGDYRILYTILKPDEILIFKISPRESAYD
ncbi:MAG: type II toxin-antitoxin system RelE/ParE family toxin [Thaumarchaeota archaeon]|nr:type II toxin-antitoxin system RelE/ParE family toxin [Nitrososphaerota archaeon]